MKEGEVWAIEIDFEAGEKEIVKGFGCTHGSAIAVLSVMKLKATRAVRKIDFMLARRYSVERGLMRCFEV